MTMGIAITMMTLIIIPIIAETIVHSFSVVVFARTIDENDT